jgi:hypothetical protein
MDHAVGKHDWQAMTSLIGRNCRNRPVFVAFRVVPALDQDQNGNDRRPQSFQLITTVTTTRSPDRSRSVSARRRAARSPQEAWLRTAAERST